MESDEQVTVTVVIDGADDGSLDEAELAAVLELHRPRRCPACGEHHHPGMHCPVAVSTRRPSIEKAGPSTTVTAAYFGDGHPAGLPTEAVLEQRLAAELRARGAWARW